MHVQHVAIENFRGISKATISLPNNALLVGSNNSCKSTVFEALDLTLGPDRLASQDAITEHDFYLGKYYDPETEPDEQPRIRIEVLLGDLSDAERTAFRDHIEPWQFGEGRPYTEAEIQAETPPPESYVLRVCFDGAYDSEEDDFTTKTYFLNPPAAPGGAHEAFKKRNKQSVGFLYLRALRTARRAATLQRGSLLDILLRLHEARPRVWEVLLERLGDVGRSLDEDESFRRVLDDVEGRLRHYIDLAPASASSLHVSRLTREHLRQVAAYFLISRESGHAVPYDYLGTGTSNVLVLALLSGIAEAKQNVIFAMEEPEIALGPHTQRRVVKQLRTLATQSLFTSHSPYVAEQFLPDSVVVLDRSETGELVARTVAAGPHLKPKILRQDFRSRFAEGLLGKAVLIVEGVSELVGLPVASDLLGSTADSAYTAFDLSGVNVVNAEGSGNVASVASFFQGAGLRTLAFVDELTAEERAAITAAADRVWEHPHKGLEKLVAEELELDVLKAAFSVLTALPDYPAHITPPAEGDGETEWREKLAEVLKSRKGEGYVGRVLETCSAGQLPKNILALLAGVDVELRGAPLPASDSHAPLFRSVDPSTVSPEEPDSGGGQSSTVDEE